MAVHTYYVQLLLLGCILLGIAYSAPAIGRPFTNAQEPGQNDFHIKRPNTDLEADIPAMDDEEIQLRDKTLVNSSIIGIEKTPSAGGRVHILNKGGITVRAHNPNKSIIGITFNNNKLSVTGKVVCNDTRKRLKKPAYQKSSEGTFWYTNAIVGEPMTKGEIDEFEKEWAKYEVVLAEKKRREEDGKKERNEREKRERELEEREVEQQRQEKERGRERYVREKNRERDRKEMEARQRQEEERKIQRNERETKIEKEQKREDDRQRQNEEREERSEREKRREKEQEVMEVERERQRMKREEEEREREWRETDEEREKRDNAPVKGGEQSNGWVNMTNPFKSDFMMGFNPFAGIENLFWW